MLFGGVSLGQSGQQSLDKMQVGGGGGARGVLPGALSVSRPACSPAGA